jgi:hypothetical protein
MLCYAILYKIYIVYYRVTCKTTHLSSSGSLLVFCSLKSCKSNIYVIYIEALGVTAIPVLAVFCNLVPLPCSSCWDVCRGICYLKNSGFTTPSSCSCCLEHCFDTFGDLLQLSRSLSLSLPMTLYRVLAVGISRHFLCVFVFLLNYWKWQSKYFSCESWNKVEFGNVFSITKDKINYIEK